MTDIAAWLKELGLERYESAFRESEITTAVLPELTEADLKELGLPLGPRKLLLRAIASLTTRSASEPTPAPTTTSREAERRQLTVLFCDLVGSTELSAKLDPEDLGQVIRAYHGACAEVVERWGGHVAKYMGDGVLAYFGWPQAHEDEAERSVRAGLALIDALAGLDTPAGEPLVARVGIATGLVMVGELIGEGAAREEAVVGETPNLAARLQTLAAPGSVVISQATGRLVGGLFELADLGPVRVKGFAAPLIAWRVAGESRTEGRFEARQTAGLTPLVGRDEEIALLLRRWQQAKDGEGHIVLMSGEPGIGKSRLVRELRARLKDEPHIPLFYQCSPYHTTSPLHPLIEQLERAAGFARDDPPATRIDKLEALLARGTDRLDQVVPLIAALLGLPTEGRYPALDLTPQRQKQLTLTALVEQLEGLAAAQPVLLAYEDMHWSDATTQELLGLTIERLQRLPVLLLITYRPEFSPPWPSQPHVSALALSRLGRREGAALVERVFRDKPLPDEVAAQIVAKTDGVPLFVEELTKAVLESGVLKDAGDHYELAGPLPPLALPSTLHDSLLARLDRLAPVKEIAQIGAALGREFPHGLLAAVAARPEAELQAALDQLVAAELVYRRGTPPDVSYSFKHALIQDAAYGTLLKSRRQQLHARIAQVLEEQFPEAAHGDPQIVAHHLTGAGLHQRASDYWLRAGLRSTARSAYVEATHNLSMALQTASQIIDPLTRREKELEIRTLVAPALRVVKGHVATELEEMLLHTLRLAEELERIAESCQALNGLSLLYLNRGELTQAQTFVTKALTRARAVGDRSCELLVRRTLGTILFLRGKFRAAHLELQRCSDLYSTELDSNLTRFYSFDPLVASLGFLSWDSWISGYPDAALRHLGEGQTYAEQLEHGYSLIHSHVISAVLYLMLRDPTSSLVHAEAVINLSAEQGLPYFASIAKACQGWAQAKAGHVDLGLERIREGLEAHQAVPWEPFMHCCRAEVLAEARRGDEALSCLAAAELIVKQTGASWWAAEIRRVRGLSFMVAATQDPIQAIVNFEGAIDLARAQLAKSWELRAAVSLARLWRDQSERRKAHDLLAPIYGWFTEGFDTADLKDAKALFDELA
jgi:class 3 adenylate cyclase/predicted ATPase